MNMHHSEPILNDQQQSNTSSVPQVDPQASLATASHQQHYQQPQQQHSHLSQTPQPSHVGMIPNQATKPENIDYNIHRVNDPSTMYNQMVINMIMIMILITWKLILNGFI